MADQTLKAQFADERKYYLGYTDKVPGSDKTVAEVRKEHEAAVAKDAEETEAKRQEWLATVERSPDNDVRTTAVTHGVVRETQVPTPVAVAEAISAPTPEPLPALNEVLTESALQGLKKERLVAIADNRNISVVPDSQNKGEIVTAILAAQPSQ